MPRIRMLRSNHDRDPREGIDVVIGAVGFFGVAFFAITVIAELTGADALGWAITLLAFVLAFAGLMIARHRITGRMTAARSTERAGARSSSS